MKTREEIDAEKAAKPRVDLIAGSALIAEGCVQAYGRHKHGDCTWTIEGTEQADPRTHIASAARHIAEYLDDPNAVEAGSKLPVLWHARAQLGIAIDCIKRQDPAAFAAAVASLPATLAAISAAKAPAVTVGSAFAAGQLEGETPRARAVHAFELATRGDRGAR